MGFRDYFEANAVCCIEWPERVPQNFLPVDMAFSLMTIEVGREMQVRARSVVGCAVLSNWVGGQ